MQQKLPNFLLFYLSFSCFLIVANICIYAIHYFIRLLPEADKRAEGGQDYCVNIPYPGRSKLPTFYHKSNEQ